ncbi:MAG: sortase, partial [Methylococcales bacterium]|nr:sortase [Methylococcales bacterium]
RLNELVEGDEIYVFFDNRKYEYLVIRKVFLEKGEEVSKDLTNNKNMLVLISCWPPGKDIRRIAVEAAIKNNE